MNLSPRMRLADVIKRIEAIPMGGTGCPADAHSDNASTIRKSQTSGLLGLTIPISAGVCSIASRPPQAIAARATASRAFGPEVP